ncbi:MAG: hypothetical protein KDK62_06535 [Chlamydiia bacterium]|nr:hypothetical protein [Chlamydiia bacterium]
MKRFYRLRKRYLTLLEVMIAFLLILIAAVPLLAPYPYIFKQQQSFIEELEMDRLSNVFYVDFVGRVLRKEIDIELIKEEETVPIDEKLPIPYRAVYKVTSSDVKVAFIPLKGGEEKGFKWVIPKVDS